MNASARLPALNGGSTGKRILATPNVEPQLKILRAAARQGFYYPALALKQLNALSAGPLGKHNVFIPNINNSRAHTLQLFHMYVPGIKATIERRSNDNYVLTQLELSDGYARIGRGQDKPGVYEVTKGSGEHRAQFRSSGRIGSEDKRVVVICAGGYEEIKDAVKDVAKRIKVTAGEHTAVAGKFDILYSALGHDQMKSYDPIANTAGYTAAGILAKAMIQAENRDSVFWISEFGGSAIFTQAMHMVAQQNITLKKHLAKMYKPTTDTTQALRLAHQLGFQMSKDFAKVGSMRTSVNMLMSNMHRARNKNDPYSWKDYAKDMATGGMLGIGLAGAGLFVATLPATSGTLGVAAATTSGIGAAHLLWTTCKNLMEKPNTK